MMLNHDGYTDLATELKAITSALRAISREIEVGRLVETLLILAVEHVGAERGLLFLTGAQEPENLGEATRDGGSVRVTIPPASATPRFPQSVLHYVLRMEESVVLNDASAENQFSHDDYMRSGRVRSILCIPLITQRKLVGVLYLENNLAPQAFAPDRLAVLELLAAQAATSLRTARLRLDLNSEIRGRERAEEELRRFHRMYWNAHLDARTEVLRGLITAMTHELNQPLGAVLSNEQVASGLLGTPKPDLEELKAAIGDIIRDNSRPVEALQNVGAIFQRDPVKMASVDLREVLHDIERIVQAEAALHGIAVRLEVPASLPPVVGDKTQLIQALMNLILNAFEAICENDDRRREVEISARQCKPGRVHVAVRDSGKGVDVETVPRLFDAFFTTKPRGFGMGLTVAHSIIENHGGGLRVARNPDRGTTAEFDLPVNVEL